MPNPENLRNFTYEERAINGRKGGLKLGENNRKRRAIKEALIAYLDQKDPNSKDCQDKEITNAVSIAIALINKAKAGDVQAATFVRDSSGEKPVDEQIIDAGELKKLVVEIVE